jgi:hypothetical protein
MILKLVCLCKEKQSEKSDAVMCRSVINYCYFFIFWKSKIMFLEIQIVKKDIQ